MSRSRRRSAIDFSHCRKKPPGWGTTGTSAGGALDAAPAVGREISGGTNRRTGTRSGIGRRGGGGAAARLSSHRSWSVWARCVSLTPTSGGRRTGGGVGGGRAMRGASPASLRARSRPNASSSSGLTPVSSPQLIGLRVGGAGVRITGPAPTLGETNATGGATGRAATGSLTALRTRGGRGPGPVSCLERNKTTHTRGPPSQAPVRCGSSPENTRGLRQMSYSTPPVTSPPPANRPSVTATDGHPARLPSTWSSEPKSTLTAAACSSPSGLARAAHSHTAEYTPGYAALAAIGCTARAPRL